MKLNPQILHSAYTQGYFPLPDLDTGQIRWYRPDPRAILPLEGFHISRSLQRVLKRNAFKPTYNQNFRGVMEGCAEREETWINPEILQAFCELHAIGAAHSVEVWEGSELVGGTYGVAFGGGFFAESMFHRRDNASKVALFYLVSHLKTQGFSLLECQFLTKHLQSLGVIEVADSEYMRRLHHALGLKVRF